MVALVLVSHSARLAEGLKELLDQVAQNRVPIVAVGGTADGRLGTDATRIVDAIRSLNRYEGVLILMDLGSSVLSAETALELLEPAEAARVALTPAPLVEGALVAAVEASTGRSLADVKAAAEQALESPKF